MARPITTRPVPWIFFLLVLCIAAVQGASPYGENPAVTSQLLFGGSANDVPSALEPTADGGYVLAGTSYSSASGSVTPTSHGGADVWVVRMDMARVVLWQKLLGGAGDDSANAIRQTSDGGYIITGYSISSASGDVTGTNHGGLDVWVVRLDPSGTILWQKLLGGTGTEAGLGLMQTADGGFVLLARSTSSANGDVTGTNHGGFDTWVVKLSAAGAIEWQRLLGGAGDDYEYSVLPTADGGYFLAGLSASSASGDVTGASHGGTDAWAVRLDGAGTILWQRLLGGAGAEYCYAACPDGDGGYVLAGQSLSSGTGDVAAASHGGYDVWVVVLSNGGAIRWQELLGGTGTDTARSVRRTADGEYIVAGTTTSSVNGDVSGTNHGNNDIWTVKLGSGGALQWERQMGGSAADNCWAAADAGGGYVVVGQTASSANGDVGGVNNGGIDTWLVGIDAVPELRLAAGWNFVSVPAALAPGHNTAAIFSGVNTDGHSVLCYNASSGAWTPMTTAMKLRPLEGLWIYSKAAATVPLAFADDTGAAPAEKELAAGWNAVGFPGTTSRTVRDALSSVQDWSTLIGFDRLMQWYGTAIVCGGSGAYSDLREVAPGEGYWLFMRDAGRLAGG